MPRSYTSKRSMPKLTPIQSRRRQQQPDSYRTVAVESTVKLLINGVLSAAAIAALLKLLPYHQSQQTELQEIRAEVKRTQVRVGLLRDDFSRNFDPQQTRTAMKEYSPRVDPKQRRVILLEPPQKP